MDVLFASRGHDWRHFFAYVDKLQMQKRTGTLYLRGPGLHPMLLDRRNWSIDKAERRAGALSEQLHLNISKVER